MYCIRKLNPLVVGSCRFQIHLCIPACVLRSEFTHEEVIKSLPAQFSWIWQNCFQSILSIQSFFNPTENWEVVAKNSLLITHAEMQI